MNYDEINCNYVHKWGIDLASLAALIINHENFQEITKWIAAWGRQIVAG